MLESQRREIMEAMGVRILLPRFQLCAAKPSCRLVELNSEPVNNANTDQIELPVNAQHKNISLESLTAVFSETKIEAEVNTEAHTTTHTDAAENLTLGKHALPANIAQELNALVDIKKTLQAKEYSKELALKFRYRLIRVGELLMLVDQPTIEWQESTAAKQFFSDIYFALTDKKPEYFSEAQFDWPPAKQFPYAHDREMAKQTLHSFMQEQMQQPACLWILLWGPQLTINLFELAPKIGEVDFINNTSALVLDSMQHYWQEPASKVLLWQSLQTVKKSLCSQKNNA